MEGRQDRIQIREKLLPDWTRHVPHPPVRLKVEGEMNRRNRNGFFIDGHPDPIFQTEERQRRRGITMHRTSQKIASVCSGCSRAITDERGGLCASCGFPLCQQCSENRCAICNRCCCDDSACSGTIRGRKVCQTHSFLEYAKFSVLGPR